MYIYVTYSHIVFRISYTDNFVAHQCWPQISQIGAGRHREGTTKLSKIAKGNRAARSKSGNRTQREGAKKKLSNK